ncbi:dimethylglycine dehydrogenase, mitochondrial-like isoform X2 [Oratosquilla oratoria]
MLLEKSELTAGSTWHAAGLTTNYHPGINLKRIHYYSLNMYATIEEETGQAVGLHRCGSLRIASTPTRVDEMKYQMARHGWHDAPQYLVTPEQVKELVPIINTEKILLGLYNPYDGHVDPYSLTQAIARGARGYGAEIVQGADVTGLQLREDGRWDVSTSMGNIIANRIVNAAGFWAKEVAKMAGSHAPAMAIQHQYLVTSSVPEVQELKREIPVLRDLEGSYYLRQERDGLLIGPYEAKENMQLCSDWVHNGVTPGFGKELFEPDLDRLTLHLEAAMEMVPCFATASIQSVVNGPITYTPDLLPIVGPDTIPNLWQAVGFGYGIVHGGGIGEFLSTWILDGEPPFDLVECDPGRFGKWTTDDYMIAKTREAYGMNNAVGYPHEERFTGRPTSRVSGAHDALVARGARMHIHSGWEQPAWFAGPGNIPEYKPSFTKTNWHEPVMAEVDLVMNSAAIMDLTPFAKFLIRGPDAAALIDYAAANSLPKVGRTVITHVLTPQGRVYAELTVTRLSQNMFFIVTGSGSEIHDLRWLQEITRTKRWHVEFQNVTEDWGCLTVAGPKALKVLQAVNSNFPSKFPFFTAKEVELAGVRTTALRLSYTGELGWELYHSRKQTGHLYEALLHHGEQYGVGDFGSHAMNIMRLEKGFKMWGAEMNLDTSVVDAGLMSFVRMEKNFVGKQAVQELLKKRPNRHCVMIAIDSPDVEPLGNETIWIGNKVVGNTTSGCFSHHLGQPLAFAYVPPLYTTPGTSIQVELLGEHRPARVLEGPPVLTHPARMAIARKKKAAAQ